MSSRMQYGTYPGKGIRTVSGVVEGACGKLVRERRGKTGSRWPAKERKRSVGPWS